MAALLFNMKELGITNEVLSKAAQGSHDELQRALQNRGNATSKAGAMSGSLRRAIPIFLSERHLRQHGVKPEDTSLEVQILVLAEEYEALTSGERGAKMSPSQAGQEVIRRAGDRYDSLVVGGFAKAFGGQVAGAGA
jgi:hypothetical protein